MREIILVCHKLTKRLIVSIAETLIPAIDVPRIPNNPVDRIAGPALLRYVFCGVLANRRCPDNQRIEGWQGYISGIEETWKWDQTETVG